MKRLIIGLAAVVLLTSCVQLPVFDRTPQWLDSPYDKAYQEAEYLCAVGSGSSRNKAVDDAMSALSQVFNSQVHSVTTVTSLSTAEEDILGKMTFSEASEMVESSKIESVTDKIVGSEVVNSHTDELGRVYVRVALNRKTAAELYQKEIADLSSQIKDLRSKAAFASDPLKSYVVLVRALALAKQQQTLINQVQVLLKQSQPSQLAAIQRELANLSASVSIVVEVATDEASEPTLKAAFSSALQTLGFAVIEDMGQATALLMVGYQVNPIVMAGSPYAYARYELTADLTNGKETLVSFQKGDREAAMQENEAIAKALRQASTEAVDEFLSVMLQSLGE